MRRWCRRARNHGHLNWLWQRGAQELIRLDVDAFNALSSTGNLLRDALTMLAAPAWWTRQRLGIAEPPWSLIGLYTRGRLLTPPGRGSPGPDLSPGRCSGTPASNRHHEHQYLHDGVTVNTIASACTPTTAVRPHRK
ncbi:MAG: hypothetical protein ACLPLP_26190 [Mycobacterium sp.]